MGRITNSMLVNNYMNNMKRNLGNMSIYQNQLSSGKNIQRVSENPYIALRTMQLNSEIAANKQYNTNIKDAINWLDTTDTALNEANNIVKRMKELAIKAGNPGYSKDEIAAIYDETLEKVKQFGQVLNTSFDGNFIFGGTKSTSKPVNVDDDGNITLIKKDGTDITLQSSGEPIAADKIVYDQINAKMKVEISDGVKVEYNKTAIDVLQFKRSDGTEINVMDKMSEILEQLEIASGKEAGPEEESEEKSQEAIGKLIGDLNTTLGDISNNILKLRSNVGAMQNRMESAQRSNEDQTYNMTCILSNAEDIDFTEKTMEYSVMQTVYIATLQTSSKVLTNTLLDYIN